MTHTPGPWMAKDDDEVWAGEVHIADCMLYAYDDYFLTHYDMPGTNEDNATILAAAPELLTMLKETADELDAIMDQKGHTAQTRAIRDRAYALIAKVKGEQ